jgi:hypothetical protein
MALLDDIVNGGNLITGLAVGAGVIIVCRWSNQSLDRLQRRSSKGG